MEGNIRGNLLEQPVHNQVYSSFFIARIYHTHLTFYHN